MEHNLILEVGDKTFYITKAKLMWEFDPRDGAQVEMYSIKFYSLEEAIVELLEEE